MVGEAGNVGIISMIVHQEENSFCLRVKQTGMAVKGEFG